LFHRLILHNVDGIGKLTRPLGGLLRGRCRVSEIASSDHPRIAEAKALFGDQRLSHPTVFRLYLCPGWRSKGSVMLPLTQLDPKIM
jgi:hypothetical protein